jgi:hypothetical protein
MSTQPEPQHVALPGPMQGAPNVEALHDSVVHFVPLVLHDVPGAHCVAGSA